MAMQEALAKAEPVMLEPVDHVTILVPQDGTPAAQRLLSETRFVEQFIRQHAGRGHGPVRIRADLRERGVPEAEIEAGLEAAGEDWTAVAREARRRRFGVSPPGDYAGRARQARFLQYRGFTHEQIRAALGPGEDIEP